MENVFCRDLFQLIRVLRDWGDLNIFFGLSKSAPKKSRGILRVMFVAWH